MISIRSLLVVGLLTAAHPALAQEDLDIVKMFEQFVTSSAAASRCVKPEQGRVVRANALEGYLSVGKDARHALLG